MAMDKLFIDEWSSNNAEVERLNEYIRSTLATPSYRYTHPTMTPEDIKKAIGEFKREEEEWIWVEGYKGTNKNIQGYDNYQFELGKRYDMPEDAEIEKCRSGYHFCLNLSDVYSFYGIGKGNRFFRVKALVRKKDWENYGANGGWFGGKKLASKSIVFISELTPEEIFTTGEEASWSHEEKVLALEKGKSEVEKLVKTRKLIECGYSPIFAAYCATNDKYKVAYAVGQENISMDMKVFAIFNV